MTILTKIISLNIGCGPKSRWLKNTEGIDIINFGQKYIGNYLKFEFKKKFDLIYAHHLIEHIPDTVTFMNKVGKDLKKDGVLDIRVPLIPYEQAFMDPTHVKFIPGPAFFYYFTDNSPAGHCYTKTRFEIIRSEKDRFPWELHCVLRKIK
jgi:SAM-dependent methyltransferase